MTTTDPRTLAEQALLDSREREQLYRTPDCTREPALARALIAALDEVAKLTREREWLMGRWEKSALALKDTLTEAAGYCIERDRLAAECERLRGLLDHHSKGHFAQQARAAGAETELRLVTEVVEAAKDVAHGFDDTCGKFPELARVIAAYDTYVAQAKGNAVDDEPWCHGADEYAKNNPGKKP